jgi:hypothetical protein
MRALPLSDGEKAVLGLALVAAGTRVFSTSARRLGWMPIMISLVLFGAGRFASWS